MNKNKIFLALLFIGSILLFLKLSQLEESNFSSTKIYDCHGLLLREICSSEYGTAYPVKLESLPKHFIETLIITEDKRFFYHLGIAPLAILRAMKQNIQAKKVVSGGSTITQQLVRNMNHYPRTIPYKILESLRAICIELRYSKRKILEEYINRIPYGNGAYGISAAAQLYLAKPAKDLSLAESAFLCAIPCSNKLFDPYRKFISTVKRQKRILTRMYLKGKIGKEDYEIALKENLSLYPKKQKFLAPHFCNWVIEKYKDGLSEIVRTTLDYNLQKKVEYIINNHLGKLQQANVTNAAVVVVDNFTRNILALVGSADFFDEIHSGQVNGVLALRQPGSTIKPFVYGAAFELGFTAADILPDLETNIKINDAGFFTPTNYDKKYHGPVRARTALACSYNVATVNLSNYFGPDLLLSKLHQAGFKSLMKEAKFYGPGLCLGNGEVTLIELVRAYTALADGGRLKELRILLDEPDQELGRIFSPQVAYLVTDILSDNDARQPAFGETSPLRMPFRCAAKTGTSKNYRDNWTVGYTPRYTVGVWVGNFSGKSMYSVSGISGAGPIFKDVMLTLEIRNENRDFVRPAGLETRTVCAKSGKLPNKYCQELIEEIFIKERVAKESCCLHKLYRIDQRNGLIAAGNCPEEFIEKKVYEVYPLEYCNWVENAKIPRPPDQLSSLSYRNLNKSDSNENGLWLIEFPRDGDIFKIDPILRREYQAITLKPRIGEKVVLLKWFIDNKPTIVERYPYAISWSIEKGKHAINYLALKENGELVKSQNIKITVLP